MTKKKLNNVGNYADRLRQAAERQPSKRAVVVPHGRDTAGRVAYTQYTFGQLDTRCDQFVAGLKTVGVERGMRVVLMVRPGLEFLPLTFALFRMGAVPILIDPGMGRKNMLRCIEKVEPAAFIGIPLAHVLRLVKPRPFKSVSIFVTIGRRWFWGGYDLTDLLAHGTEPSDVPVTADEPAAIIFTTGSTGPPKGVVYTHGMFNAQTDLLLQLFNITDDDIDMPGFTLFGMFSVAMGATVVLPDMDPTRPAHVNPERIIEAIHNHGVTYSFGSPALWNRVSQYCESHGVTFPTLTRVLMAGAPIPGYLHERMLDTILPAEANIHTPYGATENLPVTSMTGREILAETLAKTRDGAGYCVGRALPGITLRIIRTRDDVIADWKDVETVPEGEIGEVVVQGPIVSREYFNLPEQTAAHKIYESADREHGPFWHRVGDLGYLDDKGRLWFCGRKAHRVETGEETLYTVRCEAVFNEHPDIYRSALVGLPSPDRYHQKPVMIVEPHEGKFPDAVAAEATMRDELLKLGAANPLTKGIETVLFHRSFPVDIRHNAKIFREQLAVWAASQG